MRRRKPVLRDVPDSNPGELARMTGESWWARLPADQQRWWHELEERVPNTLGRLQKCATAQLALKCRCGVAWAALACGQRWACTLCRRRFYGRLRHRLKWGLEQEGRAPGVFMTLSTAHTGALAEDRAVIEHGWRRWRASAHKRFGRSYDYVGVWEITPSDAGHTHLHVFWHVDQWADWAMLRRWWVKATQGGAQWVGFRQAYGTADERAGYLAKYLSKGVDPMLFTPERAAEMLDVWRGKRVYTASQGYWQGFTQCCRQCGERQELATPFEAAMASTTTAPVTLDDVTASA